MANCERVGNVVIQTKGQRETPQCPQSGGNLALADESLGVLQQSTAEPCSQVRSVGQDNTEEASDAYALVPATGMIVEIGLSTMLWCLIILTMYWIHVQL